MSKYDAQRALNIYKTFTKQTNLVVDFLGTARQYENATRLEIPKLKHAPTSLTSSLEEYLNDPDFEVNRRQYLAHQDVKKGRKPEPSTDTNDAFKKQPVNSGSKPNASQDSKPAQKSEQTALPKGPAPDLIDFFESIEQNQQPMAVQQQQVPAFQPNQQTSFIPTQNFPFQSGQQQQAPPLNGAMGNSNPFGPLPQQQPLQQTSTGVAFNGYSTPSFAPPPQNSFSNISQTTGSSFPSQQQTLSTGQTSFTSSQQPFNTGQSGSQSTNPFRQSMFPQATGPQMQPFQSNPSLPSNLSPQSTNPFAHSATMPISHQSNSSPFQSPPPIPQTTSIPQLTPQRTGTNPFAKPSPQTAQHTATEPLISNPTGSTNPFRQSMFTNQQTGQGWPAGQQSMGGLEQLPTIPVFPRPGQPAQQNPWQ